MYVLKSLQYFASPRACCKSCPPRNVQSPKASTAYMRLACWLAPARVRNCSPYVNMPTNGLSSEYEKDSATRCSEASIFRAQPAQ